MNLVSIRIITEQVSALVKFYEQIAGISTRTLEFFGGAEVAQAAQKRSVIIELRVEDVDQDFERLVHYLEESIVQKPTVMPWGNKSFLFRDLDGNLVNFFTPVTAKALEKFDG